MKLHMDITSRYSKIMKKTRLIPNSYDTPKDNLFNVGAYWNQEADTNDLLLTSFNILAFGLGEGDRSHSALLCLYSFVSQP